MPYRDIPRYAGLYIGRKGIYRDIRGITQYIAIGKINIMSGLEPRTLCMMNGSSYHCTTSVDAEQTL